MDSIHEIIKLCLTTGLMVASPIVLTALTIGTIVSLLQTVTSIQEQTLSFVPKIVCTFLAVAYYGPYTASRCVEFTTKILNQIGEVGPPPPPGCRRS